MKASLLNAYQTNLTASYKYLNATPKQIANLQQSKGRISERQIKQSPQKEITRTKANSIHPPTRALNREDKDKLIAAQQEQINNLKQTIQKLDQKIWNQEQEINELQQEQRDDVRQSEQVNQNCIELNNIRQIVQVISERNFLQGDTITQLEQLNNQQQDEDMADQWRSQYLQLKYFMMFKQSIQNEKKVKSYLLIRNKYILKNAYYGFKLFNEKQRMIKQLKGVKQLRIVIDSWKLWKEFIKHNQQYKINLQRAIKHNQLQIQKKAFRKLKVEYQTFNLNINHRRKLQKHIDLKLYKYKMSQLFMSWKQYSQRKQYIQYKLIQFDKDRNVQQRRQLVRWLRQYKNESQQNNKQIVNIFRIKSLARLFCLWKAHYLTSNSNFYKIQYFHQFFLKKQTLNRMRQKLNARQKQKKQSYTKYNLIKLKKEDKIMRRVIISWQNSTLMKFQLRNEQYMRQISQQTQIMEDCERKMILLLDEKQELKSELQYVQQQADSLQTMCQQGTNSEQDLIYQNQILRDQIDQIQNVNPDIRILSEEYKLLKDEYDLVVRQLQDLNQQRPTERKQRFSQMDFREIQRENIVAETQFKLNQEFEAKLQEVEGYYRNLCDKQNIQIERLTRENLVIKEQNSLNQNSRQKLFSELTMLQQQVNDPTQSMPNLAQSRNVESIQKISWHAGQRRQSNGEHTQQTPPIREKYKDSGRQKSREEASYLRDDIKRRLATLQTQLDKQF